jgi:tripartite-type tricarboxylate transporter receptor subunit TctC
MTTRLLAFLLAAASLVLTAPSFAQTYPSRPITLIVPFAPGGPTDIIARILATSLSQSLGQQVIVDNRGGGGGNIGARAVAKAAPDGYTLLLGGAGSVTINPSLDPNSGYTARDFAPIGRIASMPVVITVHPSLAVHSIADLIALAKRPAGKLNVGTPNRGSGAYLAAELFKAMAGVELALIPYKGAAPLTNDLLAGHIGIGFNTIPPALGNIQSGNLRPIAVTSATRISLLPDVPTVAESGLPGFEAMLHFGLLAPAATPPSVIDRLNGELKTLLASEEAKKRIAADGGDPFGSTPAEYEAYIARETAKWSALIRRLDLKVD